MHYLDESKVFDRKCKGRGELILVNVKNQADKKEEGEDRARGVESNAAETAIKQARRCS